MPDEIEGAMIDEDEMARMYSGEQGVPAEPPPGKEDPGQQQAVSTDDGDLYPDLMEQDEGTLLEMDGEPEPEPVKAEDKGEEDEVDERGVSLKNKIIELERKLKNLKEQGQQPAQPQHQLPPPLPQDMPFQQPQGPYPQQQVYQQPVQQPQQPAARTPIPKFETAEELVAYVQNLAQQEAQGIIQQQRAQQRIQESEGRILNDFPDMANQQSPLFLWTRYYLQSEYDGDLRRAEDAAHRAARRLGIQPRSQEKQTQGQRPLQRVQAPIPSSEGSAPPSQKPQSTLSPRAKLLAKRWGQNVDEVDAINRRLISEGR